MIKKISADKAGFKTIEFGPGFNVILAERTKESSLKDSRNGLGKTLLLEIIHFCLGGSVIEGVGLGSKELTDWTFTMEVVLGKETYTISRNTSNNKKVNVVGNTDLWPIKPEKKSEDSWEIDNEDWKRNLDYLGFGLEVNDEQKYKPSFRSLFSQLARKGNTAFSDAFKYFGQEKSWTIQANNVFLLGLNWEIAAHLQVLLKKEDGFKTLYGAIKEGLIPELSGSIGEMEAELVQLESSIRSFDRDLKNFKVHPQYDEIQKKADVITEKVHALINQNVVYSQTLEKYLESLKTEEADYKKDDVVDIYKRVGFEFPETVTKRLDEVEKFHKSLIENRRQYLEDEIKRLENLTSKIKKEIVSFSEEKAELLKVLETHGALEEYSEIQNRANKIRQKANSLRDAIQKLRDLDDKKSSLKIEKEELLRTMKRDFHERDSAVRKIIESFNNNSQSLYAEPGTFSIDITDYGYRFKVDIKRAESQGVSNMKIFCYDLAIMQVNVEREPFFHSLIHDSTLFDGVDERQVAKSLELAYKESEEKNFQYICLMNSDSVPETDFSDDFLDKFRDSVRKVFTDSGDTGGLLGFRF